MPSGRGGLVDDRTGYRLEKLVPRLGSSDDGDVLATVAAMKRVLNASGHDLHDLSARIVQPGSKTSTEPGEARFDCEHWVRLCDEMLEAEAYGSEKEHHFLLSVRSWTRRGKLPTRKQRVWLESIAERMKEKQ